MLRGGLALTLLAGACEQEPPARELAEAEVAAPPVVTRPAAAQVEVPRIRESDCEFTELPAHRLTVTTAGLALDDAPASAAVPALGSLEPRELTLVIDAGLPFKDVHPLLVSLSAVDGLRLWVGLHVGDDKQLRHLPIGAPQLGVPPRELTTLPPHTYTLSLDDVAVRYNTADPLALPRGMEVAVDQVLVSATPRTRWGFVVRGLAHVCAGAVLIEAPIGRPVPEDSGSASHLRVPTLRQAKATVTGGLEKDVVRRIVREHINELRYCYNLSLARDPFARGRVTIAFTIGADGTVTAATVDESTVKEPELAPCMAGAVGRWTFPKPAGGQDVAVVYPFVLEPG
jgi:hypothetical protein